MFASAKERATSLGIQAWLTILEDEKLSVEGRAALDCLKRDLESVVEVKVGRTAAATDPSPSYTTDASRPRMVSDT